MESQLFTALIDYGMAGIFLAFMVWEHIASQKRSEKQVDRFMKSLETIRKEHQDKEQALRDRYDTVISTYNDERTVIRSNIAGRVEKMINEINEISEEVDRLVKDSVATGEQLGDLSLETNKMKNQIQNVLELVKTLQTSVSAGLNIMNEIHQSAKLKEVARQMIQEQKKE